MLIGIDVEASLERIGVQVAGPFARGADALAWAATHKPDVAVLDYILEDGKCLPLISVLKEQKVPIVIFSGWSPHEAGMPPEIRGLPWAPKPVDCNTLLKVLTEAAPEIINPSANSGGPSA
jgi:DNA-binding response OmpR family regulator